MSSVIKLAARAASVAVIALSLTAGPAFGAERGADSWQAVNDQVGEIAKLRGETDWYAKGDGSDSRRQKRIDKLLDQAVALLSRSDALNERKRLREIQDEVRRLEGEIARWRVDQAAAPEGPGGLSGLLSQSVGQALGVSQPTKETLRGRIASAEARIVALGEEMTGLKESFRRDLAAMGIALTPAQVDGLMRLATTDDIIGMQAVFENLRTINQQLLEATMRSDESIDVAKRYYGIYAVLLEVALHMQDRFLADVDQRYLARLDAIVADTRKVREEAQAMLRTEREERLRRIVEENVRAQDLTLRTAELYRAHLADQRGQVAAARSRVVRELRVAVNTYRTVTLSADLVGMLRESGRSFEAVMKLEIPELRPFSNLEMQKEFERLTDRLRTPVS